MTSFVKHQAEDNFNRARNRALVNEIQNFLNPDKRRLLSFNDVKEILKPKNEVYVGMQSVPIAKIAGSEGRYRDFDNHFLPTSAYLRHRWESIDEARLTDVTLPPILLYEIGGLYFVRDGNHRVSVAKAQGVEFIDAEVVELDSEIPLEPGMTRMQLVKRVVSYERQRFLDEYQLDRFMDMDLVKFSSPGMYPEIVNHIQVHKYFINQDRKDEIPFDDAARSWYMHVFLPIVMQIREDRLLRTFPGKTYGDLYLWIVRHWDFLKQGVEQDVTIEKASKDFKIRFGKGWFKRWREWMAQRFSRS